MAQVEQNLAIASSRHNGGIVQAGALVNPTDISVCFPNVKSNLRAYVEEIQKQLRDDKGKLAMFGEVMVSLVKPVGLPAGKVIPKHLFMSLMSSLLFSRFEHPSFFANDDTCLFERKEILKRSAHEYSELVNATFEVAKETNPNFSRWYDDFVSRLKTTLMPVLSSLGVSFEGSFVSPMFRQLAKSVYTFHALCFGCYPRPDLILRQPGSTAVRLCMHHKVFYGQQDEDDIVVGKSIAFMLLPGLSFELTIMPAVVHFVF
jgi:hypothetical protein